MLTLEYSNFLPPVLPVSPLLLSFADSKTKTEVSPASIPLFGVCFNSASSVDIYIIMAAPNIPGRALGDEFAKSRGKKSNLPLESGYQYIYIYMMGWSNPDYYIYIYKYILYHVITIIIPT